MSLINDMLKDLEKRETVTRDVPSITLISSIHEATQTTFSKKIFLISLISAILIMIVALFFLSLKSTSTPVVPLLKTEKIPSSTSPISNDDANWLKPTSIIGITMQIKGNITELTFLLSHSALYRLTSNDMVNQISLILDKSTLQSELPAINSLNTGIQRISSKNLNDDMVFTLTLVPGAVLKYVNLNNDIKNPELVIAIEYTSINANANHDESSKTIKVPAINNILFQLYQSAVSAAEKGKYQAAIQILSELIKTDPSYKDARVSLVALLLDQGKQLSKADFIVNDGLSLSPDYLPFIELKARIMTIQGKIKPALTMLQNFSPPMDDNPEYHAFIAALYERSNNNVLAASTYRKLLNINSRNSNWWFGLGVSLEKLGETKQATDAYTKAMAEGHLSADSISYVQKRLQILEDRSHANN